MHPTRLAHLDELKRTWRWKLHFTTEDASEQALRMATNGALKVEQLAHPARG